VLHFAVISRTGTSPDFFTDVLLDGLSATWQLLFSLGEGETDAHADLCFSCAPSRHNCITGIGIPTAEPKSDDSESCP